MHAILKSPTVISIQTPNFEKKVLPKTDKYFIALDEFSSGDERIERCVEQAKRVIDKDIPILIHGETGVGKEVFVIDVDTKEVTRASPKPFVAGAWTDFCTRRYWLA